MRTETSNESRTRCLLVFIAAITTMLAVAVIDTVQTSALCKKALPDLSGMQRGKVTSFEECADMTLEQICRELDDKLLEEQRQYTEGSCPALR